jgi:hypothetical protein
MRSYVAIVAFVVFSTAAVRADPPHAVFGGKVGTIGAPPSFLCGGVMATQDLEVVVTKVDRGPLKPKSKTTVRVMVCGPGPLLRVGKNGLYELDPDKIRVGSSIRVDADDGGRATWLTTTDRIVVETY